MARAMRGRIETNRTGKSHYQVKPEHMYAQLRSPQRGAGHRVRLSQLLVDVSVHVPVCRAQSGNYIILYTLPRSCLPQKGVLI